MHIQQRLYFHQCLALVYVFNVASKLFWNLKKNSEKWSQCEDITHKRKRKQASSLLYTCDCLIGMGWEEGVWDVFSLMRRYF